MFKIVIYIFLFINTISANTINVALSSNVVYVFDKIVLEFNKEHKNTKINTTISSSGKLSSQIMANAPYDMFLSANMAYANYLYQNKKAITKPVVYAKGTISLLSTKKRDFSNIAKLLSSKTIKKIAIANHKTAPYGKASKEFLDNLKIYDSLKTKFIYGESIGQTLFYTLKASNIGFVASSALKSKKLQHLKENINYINLDTKFYNPIKQGLVILKNGNNKTYVKEFYDFLLSNKAKQIFKNYGYK